MRRTWCFLLFTFTLTVAAFAKDKFQQPGPIHLTRNGEKWAEKTLHKLTLEEKIGQVFMIWCRASFLNVDNPEYLQWREDMQKYHVGSFAMTVHVDGPYLLRSEPYEAAELLNRLQSDSKLPLLFAADFERGVPMRLMGATIFPHAMAFGGDGKSEDAEAFGRISAEESRAIGIHWNFFPDADVNSNPANPIINTRSFGEDPKQVGDLVAAYIKGAHEAGMLTTVKHFPGHGDTATDSHLGVASVNVDHAHLDSIELPPFRQAIAAGVDSVMVAHVTVPALDSDPNHVATISPAIVSDLLEKQLGFKGIIVTDALDMAGLTQLFANNIGRAAVEAFKAGNDLLLIPADFPASYNAMLQAVQSGEISRERLDHSVLKILKTKASLGLQDARLVDVKALDEVVGKPANLAFGQQVADDAVTLVRDNGKVLPLTSPVKKGGTTKAGLPYTTKEETRNQTVAVLFSDDVRTESGYVFAREFRARIPDAHVIYVDPHIAAGMSDEVVKAVDEAQTVVAAVYVVPMAGKVGNSVAMADATGTLLQQVLDRAAGRTVVIAMGNPYLAAGFPKIENYMCTFSNASVSEISAVKALFGEIAIRGHLPVSIPNIAERGAGIQRPVQVPSGGSEHGQE
ncbi:MAG TPA: glycoside hydrolase family 3 N-terminal domain-containing protein [Candidatus Sulfotelmatobacter sp.]|jgi:beta-N-acetylhexosaminidase|nr:glycoside hydrolase family 3 N-terminal domain-containing protein [Candidatus Sulfotelmatobacter sp.]